MCVYIVKLPPDTLPLWRQFDWRQCDLRPLQSLDRSWVPFIVQSWIDESLQRQAQTIGYIFISD